MNDPSPTTVVDHVNRLSTQRVDSMSAYWLSVSGDRDSYANQLRGLFGERETAVLVVRTGGFDNPNSLMQDLARLLRENDAPLSSFFGARPKPPEKFGIVLLARTELKIPQSSSPVVWPEWVPGVGGSETSCYIQDISRSVEVALDSSELGLERLNRGIFELECALLRRLRTVYAHDVSTSEPFYELIRRRTDPGGWLGLLSDVQRSLDSEASVEAYRPTARGSRSLCGRLWSETKVRQLDSLPELAAALATALLLAKSLDEEPPRESLFTVLARPDHSSTATATGTANQSAHDLLLTISHACQLITCSAHAGEYGRYPLPLLQSIVDELHRSITGFEGLINRLTVPSSTSA